MNNHKVLLLLAGLAGLLAPASTQSADAPEKKPPGQAAEKLAAAEPPRADKNLRLNFRGVPLEMVLNYLSDAAGFIIILETKVEGKVDVWSNQPLNKEEAVNLLNTILNKNGYAAIRNGRTLTIVSQKEAKKRDIPVKKGGDAEEIPKTDQMVTQVIPVRHANAAQLTANLQPLLPEYAEMSANESANTLLLTATEADARRMTEIINALDESISGTSTIHVFPLRFADAKELAAVIKDLFQPPQQQQGNNRGPFGGGFGGFGGFGGAGGFGGNGGGARGTGAGRTAATTAANTHVVAVADERSNSLVVGAPDDLMETIKDVVQKIDQPVSDITELRVFHLNNADPVEMADVFGQLFPDDSKTTADQTQNQQGFRFNRGGFGGFGGPGGFGGFGNANRNNSAPTDSSERMKKKGRVLAVPDQRTSSIIVSAASELMPQIAEMIHQLDESTARKQKVFVYSLENADAQQVEQILRGMFERSTTQN
ncbi:MAG TPA: secretin N-terminal domain-containing protein, partial [Candidatus Binatia bacterium]|nr:secretin N-terminal domain-containing protein [Candidatus Binatia bacterium]